jgi:hypothetical protein
MSVLIKRNYVCRQCGKLRRAPAHYLKGGPALPKCCSGEMRLLTYEQTAAATQLAQGKRVEWLINGGKVVRRGGKRPWKAVV